MQQTRVTVGLAAVFCSLFATSPGPATLVEAQTQTPGVPAARPGVPAAAPSTAPRDATAAKAPTAIIRGRVIASETNTAIRRVQVRLTAFAATATSLRETRMVATDEQGRYEITDLPAGRYTVSASKTGYVTRSYGQRTTADSPPQPIELGEAQAIDKIDIALPLGGVVVVTVVDPLGEPLAGVQVDVLRTRFVNGQRTLTPAGSSAETNDLGQTRVHGLMPGEYYVSARSGFATLAGGRDAYAPTYYPGTSVAREAQRVKIAAAQEVNVTLAVVTAKQARISGVVRRSDGAPISTSASQSSFSSPVALRQEMPGNGYVDRGIPVKPDGTFMVPDVMPGEYTIQVRPPSGAPPAGGVPLPVPEYARVPVIVDGEDITGIAVTTQKGATLRGQLLFDTGIPPANTEPNVLRVATYYTGSVQPISTGTPTMHDDWTFEITGVVATGLLRLASTTTGWSTKSVVIEGKDVTETPMDFDPGREYKDIEVTLTQKRAEVNGTVVDAQNRATNEYVAILFPEEPERWFPRSRIILAGRPDQTGQFKIPTLPAGRFLVAAVAAIENGEEQDPELLGRLAPRATKVTLDEGETKTLTLKLLEAR